ncbi:MAG: hypothetical protein LBD97_00600 [Bifidobacteriaceae bacterium]|nr:hypothetical protein [Bifidobacteriaceae bacterium]
MSAAPGAIPGGSLLSWYDEHRVGDVALYDITRQAASVLSATLLERKRAAPEGLQREHWAARRRLVRQQVEALDPADRPGLVAQQQAWADEIQALQVGLARLGA